MGLHTTYFVLTPSTEYLHTPIHPYILQPYPCMCASSLASSYNTCAYVHHTRCDSYWLLGCCPSDDDTQLTSRLPHCLPACFPIQPCATELPTYDYDQGGITPFRLSRPPFPVSCLGGCFSHSFCQPYPRATPAPLLVPFSLLLCLRQLASATASPSVRPPRRDGAIHYRHPSPNHRPGSPVTPSFAVILSTSGPRLAARPTKFRIGQQPVALADRQPLLRPTYLHHPGQPGPVPD